MLLQTSRPRDRDREGHQVRARRSAEKPLEITAIEKSAAIGDNSNRTCAREGQGGYRRAVKPRRHARAGHSAVHREGQAGNRRATGGKLRKVAVRISHRRCTQYISGVPVRGGVVPDAAGGGG